MGFDFIFAVSFLICCERDSVDSDSIRVFARKKLFSVYFEVVQNYHDKAQKTIILVSF